MIAKTPQSSLTGNIEFKHLDNQYKDEVNALKEKVGKFTKKNQRSKRIEEQEKI